MTPTWTQRREEMLSDCLVSPDVFTQMVERLGEFVVPYQGSRQNDVKMHAKTESLKSQHDTTSQRLVFHTELASMTRMVGH